jgi:Cu/Ag efflux protein CusF
MRFIGFTIVLSTLVFAAACSAPATNSAEVPPVVTAAGTPMTSTAFAPKNGDYPGTGTVTNINLRSGSVELNHEEIKEVTPARKRELYVIDDKILKGISVGDNVDFTLRYKDGQEIITEIAKRK